MNLELHSSYTASENAVFGDGIGLAIQHTTSFTLPILSGPFTAYKCFYVLSMSKNLVSVSALCATSLVTFLFLFIFSGARSSDGGSFGDESDN